MAPPGTSWLFLIPPFLALSSSSCLLVVPPLLAPSGPSCLLMALLAPPWLLLAPPASSWSLLLLALRGSSWLLLHLAPVPCGLRRQSVPFIQSTGIRVRSLIALSAKRTWITNEYGKSYSENQLINFPLNCSSNLRGCPNPAGCLIV